VPPLPEDWVEFVESGVSILVGTRDEALRPEASRALGATVSADRTRISIFAPEATSSRTCENAAATLRVAVTFSRPIDHRALQVKGPVLAVRSARPDERVIQERYVAAYVEQLYLVGLPRGLTRRVCYWPSMVVELGIEQLFMQTPGVGAGRRLEAGS
jgi:hypothetical protein